MKGMTVKVLRSREIGHKMMVLAEKSAELGLELTDLQQGAIGMLGDSLLDRYIETGFRTILPIEDRHELCVYLHNTIGPSVYEDHGMTRGPNPL